MNKKIYLIICFAYFVVEFIKKLSNIDINIMNKLRIKNKDLLTKLMLFIIK